MLGSSQRKGAASVSADALTSRSQDGAGPMDNAHHDHGHDHAPKIENALHRVLLWIYSHTGGSWRALLWNANFEVALALLLAALYHVTDMFVWLLPCCGVDCIISPAVACRTTGLFQAANLLRENTIGSIAISVLFAVAAATHWQAGQALSQVHAAQAN